MPFFSMGGVVVSYNLFNGQSGAVLSAGAIPISGGFVKVGHLSKFLEDSQDTQEAGAPTTTKN